MRVHLLFCLFVLLAQIATSPSYAAGCGDLTLCVKDPPNPPDPPACTTYPNYCSFVAPQIETATPKEALPDVQQVPGAPGYSITLNNLSKEQLNKILSELSVDTSKVKAPQ
jgi:hypothetical protein